MLKVSEKALLRVGSIIGLGQRSLYKWNQQQRFKNPKPTLVEKQRAGMERYWADDERSSAHRIKMVEIGRKVGRSNKGKPKSIETRLKMSVTQRKRKNHDRLN